MLLVAFRRKHAGALRADFRRYYSARLSDIGHEFTVLEAADWAVHLPPESALKRELNDGWTNSEMLLAELVDTFRLNLWTKTKDGSKNRNRPKPIPRPGVVQPKQRAGKKDVLKLTVEETARRLALPRKTVTAPN